MPPGPTGWIRRDESVDALRVGLQRVGLPGVFSAAVPRVTPDEARAGRLFCADWENEPAVVGRVLDPWQQTIGSCVGYGTARAITSMMIDRVAARDIPRFQAPVSPAALYGGARVNVGRGRLGYGDGAIVAEAVEWALQCVLLQVEYAAGGRTVDLSHDSRDSIAQAWGRPGAGVPRDLAEIGTGLAITGAVQCQSIDDVVTSLWLRHWVTGGCDWIDTDRRDQNGQCRPASMAGHCQNYCGVYVDQDADVAIIKRQSWGVMTPSGPQKIRLKDGSTRDLPAGCYGIKSSYVDKVLHRDGDFWAIKGGRDWVPQTIDFGGAV